MARDGEALTALVRLSRFDTPHVALFVQAMVAVALAVMLGARLSGLVSFHEVFAWSFIGVVAMAMLVLRRRAFDAPRPYCAPLASALICIAAAVALVGSTTADQPLPAVGALVLIGCGWPINKWLVAPLREERLASLASCKNGSQEWLE